MQGWATFPQGYYIQRPCSKKYSLAFVALAKYKYFFKSNP